MANLINTLNIPEDQLELLLTTLDGAHDESPEAKKNAQKRTTQRWPMHAHRVIVTLEEREGHPIHFLAATRNISSSGMAFLHGGFVHTSRQCFVTLRSITGEAVSMKATIRRCRVVRGRLHEIGVQFDTPIDPKQFVECDPSKLADTKHLAPAPVTSTAPETADESEVPTSSKDANKAA